MRRGSPQQRFQQELVSRGVVVRILPKLRASLHFLLDDVFRGSRHPTSNRRRVKLSALRPFDVSVRRFCAALQGSLDPSIPRSVAETRVLELSRRGGGVGAVGNSLPGFFSPKGALLVEMPSPRTAW